MIFLFACISSSKSPVVESISFRGNGGYWSTTNDEQLRNAMKQKENRVFGFLAPDLWMVPYNQNYLDQDGQRLEVWYAHHGYFDAKFQGWNQSVVPSIFSLRPHIRLEGVVSEGSPALIRTIGIHGDMYGTLRKGLQRILSPYKESVFSLEDIEYVEELLRSYLHERSYAKANIKTDILVWPNDCIDVRHHQGQCIIANLEAYCERECREVIQRVARCGTDNACITQVNYKKWIRTEKSTVVDVRFHVDIGASYRFGEIHIHGDTNVPLEPVLDKVVQEARLRPGSSYKLDKIYRAQEVLYNMGLFSVVNIVPNYDEGAELVRIDIELEQTSFADVNLGVGAENDLGNLGVHLLGEFNHNNLWNRLMQVRWKNELGYAWLPQNLDTGGYEFQQGFVGTSQLQFLVPNLYRSLLSFDGGIIGEAGLKPGYQFGLLALQPSLRYLLPVKGRKIGFCTFRLGYELSYRFYFQEEDSIKDVLFPYVLSSIQQEVILDGRDKAVYTSGGQYFSMLLERSTALYGKTPSFHRLSFEHRAFLLLDSLYSMYIGKDTIRKRLLERKIEPISLPVTMAFRWSGGLLLPAKGDDGNIPFDDLFVLGGGSDVRGWAPFRLGPYRCSDDVICLQDGVQQSRDIIPVGGLLRVFGNLEARYYTPEGYGAVLFLDAGRVFATRQDWNLESLEYSAGIGLRYKSSIGPFRLDIARRLGNNSYFQEEPRWAFHLALSESF
ncbi:MAG: hypothetical protein CL916_08180 [Deltaproteobacteria bacterium]|nr:hypothetical protein [Deltaproteobacteria bacterium]